jgi:uncharacterized protein (DUF4415 family)
LADKDNPELTAEEIRAMRPAAEVLPPELVSILPKRKRGERGPQKTPVKQQVTLRLDAAVLAFFKTKGRGWQTRINDALKNVVERKKSA